MAKRIITLFAVLALALINTAAENNDSPTDMLRVKNLLNGFPTAMWCDIVDGDWEGNQPTHNDTVQCEIRKDGREEEALFADPSIEWKDISTKGYFFDVSPSWQNVSVTVSLTFQNNTKSQTVKFTVDEPELPTKKYPNATLGRKMIIPCPAPRQMKDTLKSSGKTTSLQYYMSEDQFNSIKTVWKKDGKVISMNDTNFSYGSSNYHDSNFAQLVISTPSFETTPGLFECILEYGQDKLLVKRRPVCIKDKENRNQPQIETLKPTYYVAPGDDVELSCHGVVRGSSNIAVYWKKNGTRLCHSRTKYSDDSCSMNVAIPTFCKPASPEETSRARMIERGNFTAVFTLRNFTDKDSGIYECLLATSGKHVSAEFEVVLMNPPKKTHRDVTVVVAVVAGLIAMIALLRALYCWKRLEIHYFMKKRRKYIETDELATFFVYSDDVYEKKGDNPLKDVTQWMKGQGYAFHNPSDGISYLDAGELAVQHSLTVLEGCLTMTVILTPNLLTENSLEIFKLYTGFVDNVERDVPVIFICTKEMEKRIYAHAATTDDDSSQNLVNLKTLRHFMKRKKNKVIHWRNGGSPKFYRRLYVALPKARFPNQENSQHEKEEIREELVV